MPKFVVIDHSIAGVGGHYYEYARHVLQAAKEAGYDPVLVANRAFRASEPLPWPVHAIYKVGYWGNLSQPSRFETLRSTAKAVQCGYLRCRTRLVYSRAFLLWYIRRRPGAYLRSHTLTARFPIFWLPVVAAALTAKCLAAAVAACREMMPLRGYLARVAGAASRVIGGVGRLVSRLVSRGGWPCKFATDRYRLHHFTRSTRQLSRVESLSPGDVVLLPTTSEIELAGLATVLRGAPSLAQAHWHLIFRRNLFPGRQEIEFSASPELTAVRGVFQSCADLHERGVLAYFTDTEELTAQYRLISGALFRTLPIPHTQPPRESERRSRPACVSYLGDARTEKGYQHLPRIIGDLLWDHIRTGKASFVIQSNYNVPQGEPAAIVARSQLRRFVPHKVTLVESPLDSPSYWDMVHSSDISLLPYDRDNYYARSSGILAESLAAGVPVLVPAGTWMSRQIIDEIYQHRLRLREQLGVAGCLTASDLKPRVEACPKAIVRKGNDWWVCGGLRWTTCRFDIVDSRWMLVSLSLAENKPGDLLEVRVLQSAANRLLVSKSLHYLEQHAAASRAALLVPLDRRACRLRIGFRNAVDHRRLVVSAPQIDFLGASPQDARLPTGSVGLVYRAVEDIPALLREMVDHREHYRKSAREFSRAWVLRHNAASFVATLRGLDAPEAALPGRSEPLCVDALRNAA